MKLTTGEGKCSKGKVFVDVEYEEWDQMEWGMLIQKWVEALWNERSENGEVEGQEGC